MLDEQVSPAVGAEVLRHRPDIEIESVHVWQYGSYLGQSDRALLLAARMEGWTLVTYDQKTIPPLLVELAQEGEWHAGVVFVDDRTIASNDFGGLTRALLGLHDIWKDENLSDRVLFLAVKGA